MTVYSVIRDWFIRGAVRRVRHASVPSVSPRLDSSSESNYAITGSDVAGAAPCPRAGESNSTDRS